MTLESVSFIDGTGSPVAVGCVTIDGVKVPVHVAEVRLVDFMDRSGMVTAMGAVALDIPANTARKGGELRAPLSNNGNITLTIKKTDGTASYIKTLEPGSTFPLTVNPGFVLPHEIEIRGGVVNDRWEGVEFV